MFLIPVLALLGSLGLQQAPPASSVVYALSQLNDTLFFWDEGGTTHVVGDAALTVDFDPVGPQQTCIDAREAVLYALAVNKTSQETVLIGLSLANASRVYEAPAPISQQGVLIGQGATVDCVGNGHVVVTGQLEDGTHAAFELVPSTGRTTPLATGFLANQTVKLLDAAHTLQTSLASPSPSYVLWVVVAAAAPPGTFDLVAIDLRSGETTQRLHLGGGGGVPATFPHTLAYDGASDTLLCTGLDTSLTPIFFTIAAASPHNISVMGSLLQGRSVSNGLSTFDPRRRVAYVLVGSSANASELLVGVSAESKAVVSSTNIGNASSVPFNIDFF
eukprot:g1693.t1